ncbi:hypothetical protein IPZ61_25670 [Streptomyces sioyaensis]|uniref:DUF6083 domain-containing protein n=1 Tax=Streptomyces sioyaensis TaxID=67364 RepID=UPI001F3B6E8F|nr:DUF6083 domain-containing protein [Streptomyces sioyaensis]MCF3176702.1 hypothetical protein [Streptomyces sioyaensis]
MGATEDTSQGVCQSCHTGGPTVRDRGRISLMAVLCDPCWNAYANQLAIEEGATAPPQVDPDPDDVTPYEPPTCSDCGAAVKHCATNYDRWIYLAVGELPAKDVAPRYRWRLQPLGGRHSRVPVEIVAVRIRGIEPLPSDLVWPAHRAVCLSPEAVQEVEQERAAEPE